MKTIDSLNAEVQAYERQLAEVSWRLDAALRLADLLLERYNECMKAHHPPETLDNHWAEVQEIREQIRFYATG